MKHPINFFPIVLAATLSFGFICSGASGQQQSSALKDKDGNSYTTKILPGNKKWLTDNLKINIPGSYCYENVAQNCDRYGRLYTWKSAQEGCKLLGKGWRLPTNEEWRKMAGLYGGIYG
ncbi:MAG TPA: FISUMP domain-containing protein, partial [Chitinophagaceae bacterium]|nr:FISUMP domain-containing protein [Chitinophagaceae bacterium]